MNRSAGLRELFKREGVIRVIGGHDALGARIAERTGFDAIWASGLEISTSHGVPDANILTMTDFLNAAVSMNAAVSIPIIADCDTGFGNSNNVIHMVKRYEAAGIAAVCVEDKHFPKVNSFVPGRQELAPISEFVGKILAGKNAQATKEFMLIARVEALIAGWGMDEAIKRSNAYVDAGADAILVHSKLSSITEIAEFVKRWKNRAPLIVVPTAFFKTNVKEFEKLKIKMVIYANHGIRASILAMRDTFASIYRYGSTAPIEGKIASMKEVFDIQGMHKMKESELIYSGHDKEKVVAVIPAAGDHLEEYSMKDISSDIPITMLDINGKPLLQKQVETLNRCKVYDIRVVAGYKKEKIAVEGVRIIDNDNFKKTGILYSIMRALNEIDQRAFIAYGDTIFDHIIFERMAESPKDITILVDKRYSSKDYDPQKRIDFVVTDSVSRKKRRLLHADSLRRVIRIGSVVGSSDAEYEFPGMIFLSQKGVKVFKDIYNESRNRFKKAGIADLLNEAIKRGVDIYCIEASSGWMEIHSLEDYKLACSLLK